MNEGKPWFRPKRIGWGWTPNSWQGWLVTVGVIMLIAAIARLAH